METNKVYCYKCGWVGTLNQLDMLEVDAIDEDGNDIRYSCCPVCGSLEGIMPFESEVENHVGNQ